VIITELFQRDFARILGFKKENEATAIMEYY